MNYSDYEHYDASPDDEPLIEAGLELLPHLSRALYAAISDLGQAHGLTSAQVKVLLHLGRHGQMTVGEVAAALGTSMPAASALVDRLVEAGHLVRKSDPADRRRVLIVATPEAEAIGAELCQLRRAQLQYALAQIAPDERPTFIRALEALVAGLTHAAAAMPHECARANLDRGISG
jgi:DNA-binding MarR family transcriptional regulator